MGHVWLGPGRQSSPRKECPDIETEKRGGKNKKTKPLGNFMFNRAMVGNINTQLLIYKEFDCEVDYLTPE